MASDIELREPGVLSLENLLMLFQCYFRFTKNNICCVAVMGAPEIIEERLLNKTEMLTPIIVSQQLLELGFKAGLSTNEIEAIVKEKGLCVKTHPNSKYLVRFYLTT